MSNIPVDLKYAKSHEWARVNDDGTVTAPDESSINRTVRVPGSPW